MEYTVKSGDTLSGIAQQLDTSVSNLTGYSSGNPNLIYPGEVIRVGGQQATQATNNIPQPSVQQQNRTNQSNSNMMTEDEALNRGIDVNVLRREGRLIEGGGGGGGGFSMPQQPTIDLQAMYQKMFDSSGVKTEEEALTAKQAEATTLKNQLAQAETEIGDNPFISEANRVGRVNRRRTEAQKRLDTILEEQNQIQGRIQKQKADIEMKLNMQMKQFDIESQQAQQALSNLNTYMSLGLLDNASDAEIAQLTRATGISSSMIQGAIQTKNDREREVALEYIQDDSGNVTVIAVDKMSGEIVNQSTATGVAKVTRSSGRSSGGGSTTKPKLTAAQIAEARKTATSAIKLADTNKDKLLSWEEYESVIQGVMNKTGLDFESADEIASQVFTETGYKSWRFPPKKK